MSDESNPTVPTSESATNEEQFMMRETWLPVARELSEMLLTKMDLANSLASLTVWVEGYTTDVKQEDQHVKAIRGSLFRDAITQFVGCFDSKNAFPLIAETVYPNVEGIRPYFRWLRDLRNSYTAHRHGSARQCVVGVLVDPTSGKYRGHGNLFTIYAGPSQQGHAQLLSLVRMAIGYVEGKIAILQQQFETEAAAIPQEELLKLPFAAVQPQEATSMAKSRGAIQKRIVRDPDMRPLEDT